MKSRNKRYWYIAFCVLFYLVVGLGICKHFYPQLKKVVIRRTFTESTTVARQHQFQDLNAQHLTAAKSNGIKPVKTRKEVGKLKVKRIEDCDLYMVDNLAHSVPYLTDDASKLLTEIGMQFQKELTRKGFRTHRLIVTSVLRTEEDIIKLTKVNRNATHQSAHMYGTTFDITYIRFNRISLKGKAVSNQQMADILGEVLGKLRKEKRCYVKSEFRQHCFHITARM